MARSYNIKTGLVFAALIGFLAAVLPRMIRFDIMAPCTVAVNFIHLFVTVFFYWMMHQWVMNKANRGWWAHPVIKPVVSICLSVFCIALVTAAFNISGFIPVKASERIELSTRQMRSVRLFRALIMSAFTYFVVYYYRMQVVLQQSRFENEHLKQEHLQAQLSSLKQQISPHFLFNSLNTLSSLSQEASVKEYILNLSEVYRYVLRYQQQTTVSVNDELGFIHAYLYILKSRFEEGINITIQVSTENRRRKILPFSLQLLVENAIKHNAVSYSDPLLIHIYDAGDRLVIANSLKPRTTMERPSGTGLHNLLQRYQLTAGREINISKSDTAFTVEIPFL
jgi:sensor histidine kinase YesM